MLLTKYKKEKIKRLLIKKLTKKVYEIKDLKTKKINLIIDNGEKKGWSCSCKAYSNNFFGDWKTKKCSHFLALKLFLEKNKNK